MFLRYAQNISCVCHLIAALAWICAWAARMIAQDVA
jgi:hypothetical protein